MDFDEKKRIISKNKLAIIITHDDHTEYRCVGCSAKFPKIEKLELHLYNEHNNVYKHLCSICGTGLKRKEHLDRHVQEHREVRPHICPDCGKGFKRREHLNIHKSIHTGEKDQLCCFCNKSFYRKDHLQKHMQTHSKEIADAMGEHQVMSVNQEEIDIKQEITDNDEDMPLLIEQPEFEETMIELTAEKPHVCPICQKRYKRKDHLKIHSWTHREKDRICSQCGKGFHTDTQLFVHMSTHLNSNTNVRTSKDDRPHECPICHRKFKRKSHLNAHASVHNKGFASIWCSLCTEGFTTNEQFEQHNCSNMKREEALNIKIEDEYTLVAPQEEYNKKENTYPEPHELVEVTSTPQEDDADPIFIMNTNEQDIPVPQRVFVCKFCSKPFKRKDHYKIHLHVHTGIKSFFCPDCGKGFYRKDHLQKHLQVHNKPKPKPKKALPDLYPISLLNKQQSIRPEITITAPSNTKLRVPLQIKVPYQVVTQNDDGERQTVTIDPQTDSDS